MNSSIEERRFAQEDRVSNDSMKSEDGDNSSEEGRGDSAERKLLEIRLQRSSE
jgi:hypothetical protein